MKTLIWKILQVRTGGEVVFVVIILLSTYDRLRIKLDHICIVQVVLVVGPICHPFELFELRQSILLKQFKYFEVESCLCVAAATSANVHKRPN